MAAPRRRRASRDVQTLARRLRKAGRGDLVKILKKSLRESTKPLTKDARVALANVHIDPASNRSRRRTGPGFRKGMSKHIKAKAVPGGKIGLRIELDMGKLGRLANVPNLIEKGRLRHPLFGNRERWYTTGSSQWWAPTVRQHLGRIRRQMNSEVESAIREIAND